LKLTTFASITTLLKNTMFPRRTHVCFANPIIHSVSRKPTRVETYHINLLESHTLRCTTYHRLMREGSSSYCRRLAILEKLLLLSFMKRRDGHAYSVHDDGTHPVRVEIPGHYVTLHALLDRVDSEINLESRSKRLR
jgi:hypothetical protein